MNFNLTLVNTHQFEINFSNFRVLQNDCNQSFNMLLFMVTRINNADMISMQSDFGSLILLCFSISMDTYYILMYYLLSQWISYSDQVDIILNS